MSSSDALHPQQLQMFMPARELLAMTPSDYNPNRSTSRTVDDMWANKLEESKEDKFYPKIHADGSVDTRVRQDYNSLHASIASEGVLKPVQVTRTAADFGEGTPRAHLRNQAVLFEGHHRVAAANDIDPQMEVPVDHYSVRVH